ncbi:MarR family transcriptional regulator [Paenibacillaceae bacterium]|nr:MarR family transcriptional regulator [Paenibacillaceae bacterium]
MDRSDSIFHLMTHTVKMYRHKVDQIIKPYDVYPGQPPLLLRLSEKDGRSQSELASLMRVAPATLTVMVDRMEKTGLVMRRSDPVDQRVSRIFLTDKGHTATEAVKEAIQFVDNQCLAQFLPEEKLLLRRLILQIQENLNTAGTES